MIYKVRIPTVDNKVPTVQTKNHNETWREKNLKENFH